MSVGTILIIVLILSFNRRHTDLGSQQSMGLWSVGNCGCHTRRSPHLAFAGQNLIPGRGSTTRCLLPRAQWRDGACRMIDEYIALYASPLHPAHR